VTNFKLTVSIIQLIVSELCCIVCFIQLIVFIFQLIDFYKLLYCEWISINYFCFQLIDFLPCTSKSNFWLFW